ncbi:hypothetical protein [Vibrio diazotrophicus]|uniref:hypothetical protein n=1 Tax=Vibrio diazotrophicus TaxID=685 RepID=UPI000C9E4E4C|nr:hypothetical protein [Vibrio diazotrophicus]PNH81354.1 hypothetical protein C1N27_07360 [Vibrio diazotrophicus]
MDEVKRYLLLDSYYNNDMDRVIKAGFDNVFLAAKNSNNKLTIAINNKTQCKSHLEKIFDEKSINALVKGNITTHKGVNIELKTIRTINNYDDYGCIYAIYPSDDLINKIESCHNKTLVMVVSYDLGIEYLYRWYNDFNVEGCGIDRSE